MSWTTVIWSMVAAISLTMALPHLVIGLRNRSSRANLFFVLAACAVPSLAAAEFKAMHAATPAEIGRMLQLGQIPVVIMVVGIMGFIHFYFGTGRWWLGLLAAGLRFAGLFPTFLVNQGLAFREITGLRSFPFLGETLVAPVGEPSRWVALGYVSSILVLVYVIDASLRLWRQGKPEGRRRAVTVGGGVAFFIVVAQGAAALVNLRVMAIPFIVSLPFLAIVVAMGIELTYDVIRAAQLSHALQASEERMALAAERARLALWEWDVARDELWMTAEGRELLGFAPEARLKFASLAERVHPDDHDSRVRELRRALETGGAYEMEYRLLRPDGAVQWIGARGRCARDGSGTITRMLGVSMDITRQKQADLDVQRHRDELGHLARVALVGEMATSLAHELNQPLTAIVTNAGAAQRFLARDELKREDLREILGDIAADGRRAGAVIRGIKGMVRKVDATRVAVNLNDVIADVLRLVRADALAHNCTLATELEPDLPAVTGDAVQLQQVLLNLVINAFDAMRQNPGEICRVELSTRRVGNDAVEVAVRDHGPGLPPDAPAKVFERFFSTKQEGMGMGLAIARSLIEAHGGTLDAANVAAPISGRGARFWFRLPVRVAAATPKPS